MSLRESRSFSHLDLGEENFRTAARPSLTFAPVTNLVVVHLISTFSYKHNLTSMESISGSSRSKQHELHLPVHTPFDLDVISSNYEGEFTTEGDTDGTDPLSSHQIKSNHDRSCSNQ